MPIAVIIFFSSYSPFRNCDMLLKFVNFYQIQYHFVCFLIPYNLVYRFKFDLRFV